MAATDRNLMRATRITLLLLGIPLWGCGASEGAQLSLTMPWPQGVHGVCSATQAELGDRLRAVLRVGSFSDCVLDVDPVNRTASGSCPGIVVGIERDLAFVWTLDPPASNPTGDPFPLSYGITSVDLSRNQLDPQAESVDVNFVDDGVTGEVLWHPEQLSTSTFDCNATTGVDLVWAVTDAMQVERDLLQISTGGGQTCADYLVASQALFDHDGDGCANLMEACDATIDAVEDNSTNCRVLTP